ncbi:MAG TPA: hypothetical protein VM327_01645 [Candidatus Thermoplasmatota archaeon]|nr:hypothetical protein [Candidatus Thermoplasmatota archaeon]
MAGKQVALRAADGYRLAATYFPGRGRAKDAVVIAGATGVKRSFYDAFATFLASRGLDVVTLDYRGV